MDNGYSNCRSNIIIYIGGDVFRTDKLSINDLIMVILLAFTVIPVDLIRKYITRKSPDKNGT